MNPSFTAPQQKILNDLLIEALREGDFDHVKLYVSRGADVNTRVGGLTQRYKRNGRDFFYETTADIFHYMCAVNFREDIADFLLEKGARVDTRDGHGNTPLMVAVKGGDLAGAVFFLARGADPLSTNNEGAAVLEVARGLDRQWHGEMRQKIIDALVTKLPQLEQKNVAAAAFEGKGTPANNEKQGGIVAPKTASFGHKAGDKDAPKKPATGFRL